MSKPLNTSLQLHSRTLLHLRERENYICHKLSILTISPSASGMFQEKNMCVVCALPPLPVLNPPLVSVLKNNPSRIKKPASTFPLTLIVSDWGWTFSPRTFTLTNSGLNAQAFFAIKIARFNCKPFRLEQTIRFVWSTILLSYITSDYFVQRESPHICNDIGRLFKVIKCSNVLSVSENLFTRTDFKCVWLARLSHTKSRELKKQKQEHHLF